MKDDTTSKAAHGSSRMACIRSTNTAPEMRLRSALWASGFRYRVRLKLPGTPDIAFPGQKVVVFVDGCFWHGCPRHYRRPPRNHGYWDRKLERNRDRDRRVDSELEALGWASIRVWEHEIEEDVSSIVHRIRTALRRRSR